MNIARLIRNLSVSLLALTAPSGAFAAGDTPNKAETIDGFRDTPMEPDGKWHVHDPDRPQPAVVTPGQSFSQNAGAPADAEVLFDGTDLSKWENNRGQDATWNVRDG